ncbi:MAG: diaminopimelate epimerase [Thermoanaerobaculales bacterium]|nr:diaminopimelate epimerase [Thermoanaerobaculales bacterium]
MKTALYKVEGAGNDFLLGTGDWAHRLAEDAGRVAQLCRRRRGLGADGTLALFPADGSSLRLVHRNADGSPSDFCANGTRCAARVAVDRLGLPARVALHTGWGVIPAEVKGDLVTLELPPAGPAEPVAPEMASGPFSGHLISVGVPHFVAPVEGLATVDLDAIARPLRHHPDLGPEGANIHLVEDLGDGRLGLRSLERGVESEVLCCGSGVVAAALTSMAGSGRRRLTVLPRSGDRLEVEALGAPPAARSRLTGPARIIARVEPV